MLKYAMLRESVEASPLAARVELVEADPIPLRLVRLAHDPDYIRRVLEGSLSEDEVREIGFPWSSMLVERSLRSLGGTLGACRAATRDWVSMNFAGGTHHARRDRGAGYCLFNDAAVALLAMRAEGAIARGIVVDCDVHQGDGTASILRDEPSLFAYSLHGARNYPARKIPGDLDVELPDGADDDAYLEALERTLPAAFDAIRPELAVYLAGADPYVGDGLGRLSVSAEGLRRRDRFVLETCRARGVPVAIVMAGGYSKAIAETVAIHRATLEVAIDIRDATHPREPGPDAELPPR